MSIQPVNKVINVEAPREIAFKVFTAQMSSWWPLSTHKIGSVAAKAAVLEPKVGGRWYEVGVDGSECEWGRVLAWEPPNRLVLNWQIAANWTFDPSLTTEVEVKFIAEGPNRTRVELEHRNLERFGDQAQHIRSVFDSEGGWGGMLESYSRTASSR